MESYYSHVYNTCGNFLEIGLLWAMLLYECYQTVVNTGTYGGANLSLNCMYYVQDDWLDSSNPGCKIKWCSVLGLFLKISWSNDYPFEKAIEASFTTNANPLKGVYFWQHL